MHYEQGSGCAIVFAALLWIAAFTCLAFGYWAPFCFIGLAAGLLTAALLDPG